MFVFLYPESYFKNNKIEESFEFEYEALKKLKKNIHLFNIDKLEEYDFTQFKGKTIFYRGWALKDHEYKNLEEKVIHSGAKLAVSSDEYLNGLYMPNWVDKLEDLTPKSYFFRNNIAAYEYLEHNDHHKYFVKDYVKSLKDISLNVVSHREELEDWIADAEFVYGELEGGICLREIEKFQTETEIRYFILNGKVYSNTDNEIPDIVYEVLNRIKLPFYSLDIVLNDKNEWRVVEIGDGQISSSLTWDVNNFVKIFENI